MTQLTEFISQNNYKKRIQNSDRGLIMNKNRLPVFNGTGQTPSTASQCSIPRLEFKQ